MARKQSTQSQSADNFRKAKLLSSESGGLLRTKKAKRRGFLAGQISIPADFDRMDAEEIERQFDSDL